MILFEHPYAAFLHRVEKPNRYTGAEHGTRKKPWAGVEAKICLAFPEIYDIGMSHLGFRILYKLLNDDPRTLAERCYAPWVDLQAELAAHGQLLVSLENARPLCDFDVVGFSLQYELTYTTLLRMLDLGGIPLRSQRRSDHDPLILAGGPVATHCEPIAPFVDAVLIGDGEEAASEIALAWVRGRAAGLTRVERLRELARIPGVYVPSLYATAEDPDTGFTVVTAALPEHADVAPFPVTRRLVEDLDRFPFPDDGPVGGPEAIFDRMSIEVARGCTEGCRFCQAGMIYRPVRERDPRDVVRTVISALEKSGQDEVSLTALSTADVSCISPLIKDLVEKTAPERVSLSVASLRAYGLGEDLLDEIRRVRAGGLTFAPEAGTQRMRDVINKNVTEGQLLETAERVFKRGFDRMKLYFICGLPTEEDEDVRGIVEVGKHALAVGKRVGRRATVTVSVSVHVPKPHTPFQWAAMDTQSEIQRKQALLKDCARGVKGLTLKTHDEPSSILEGILARGDRRVAEAVERAYHAGAQFDTWGEHLDLDAWYGSFAALGIEPSVYLGTIPTSARLPWDHFDVGLEDGFLAREYRKALASRLSPPCGKAVGQFVHHTNVPDASADARRLVCYDCGIACDLTRMREQRVEFLTSMGAHDARRLPLLASAPTAIAPRELSGDDSALASDTALTPADSALASDTALTPDDSALASGTALTPADSALASDTALTPVDSALASDTALTPDDSALASDTALTPADSALASDAALTAAAGPGDPPDPAPSHDLQAVGPTRPRPAQRGPEALRPLRSGEVSRFRLSFEKVGPLALLGHLDLIRELPRALRRAGLRIAYTQGYHPKADLSFGPALSLGVASLDEHVDVKLLDAPDPEVVLQRLARVVSGGLRFTRAARLGPVDPGLSRVITGARYVIALPRVELRTRGGSDWLAARVTEFLARSEHKVRREIEGIGKLVDVRSFVTSAQVGDEQDKDVIAAAGVVGDVVPLSARVVILGSGAVKVSEIVEAVTGEARFPFIAVRAQLLAGEGGPLDLELHRRRAEGRPATERSGDLVSA